MRPKPRAGEIYRHFKNRLYQIITVAQHTETGEELVIYQALYGDFRCYARPLSMFMSPVDREKYPDAPQEYRFMLVQPSGGTGENGENRRAGEGGQTCETGWTGNSTSWEAAEETINPWLEQFLDAEGYEKQLEALSRMRGKVGQKELDSLYLILDIQPKAGHPDSQLMRIIKDMETRKRYDGSRLR